MIAICPNPFRDTELLHSFKVRDMLEAEGFECAICPVFAENEPEVLPEGLETYDVLSVIDRCSLIIVIGGDGTMLSVARSIHGHSVPMLGINLGTKGFMADLEADELCHVISAAKGECAVGCRMKLEISLIRDGEVIYNDCALNDAVIHGYGDCVKLTAYCDDHLITSLSGDGIILATPTGSTGYSMSAGGPIVEPEAANILVTPICAHVMGSRTFVLDPSRVIRVKAQKLHGRRAFLSVDGNSVFDLANGDELIVKRSDDCTLMAKAANKSFFDTAYEKLR